ncbi:hypothetical protein AAVH_26197 [Aphelenchoides avenae]|nr:hypothetical protein AAVH_26197 [Aphelenchus avenae]
MHTYSPGDELRDALREYRRTDISKGSYAFRVSTAFGTWTSPKRNTALLSQKTTCALGPFDPCVAICRTDCSGVTLKEIAPDATLASDPKLSQMYVPTLAQQVAVCRATRKLHGASLGELCKRLLTNPDEVAEKILATSLHAPFDTPIEDVLLPQARLRASRCALTRAALEASKDFPLTFITTSADANKAYTSLELDDGLIGLYTPGANLLGQVWEEVRSGGVELLKEPFHVICTAGEKPFFEQTAALVHVADDQLQKTRFFENNRFSGSCMAALVTLEAAGESDAEKHLFEQLLAAIKKVSHMQVVITPPPPIQNAAYLHQATKLMEEFPGLYAMTDIGGSMLQIGRYGNRPDRCYVLGDKWNKDGILALKAHLIQVCGQHWLRNMPKANAPFPLRQLDQLQLSTAGVAPQSQQSTSVRQQLQPSASVRAYNARLHSTRGGRINRRDPAPRSGSRSDHAIDPHLLNSIISALQPSSSSSKPHHHHQKRQ